MLNSILSPPSNTLYFPSKIKFICFILKDSLQIIKSVHNKLQCWGERYKNEVTNGHCITSAPFHCCPNLIDYLCRQSRAPRSICQQPYYMYLLIILFNWRHLQYCNILPTVLLQKYYQNMKCA